MLRPLHAGPLLMGANLTQPRASTPTTEVSIVETISATKWWKLIILAGQSTFYTPNNTRILGTDACLAGRQPDPPMPGRTDALVNGCPVCNETRPCLYDLLADAEERKNVAAANPDVVARLAAQLSKFKPYVTGHLSAETLSANYTQIPKGHWGNFLGPCYYRKGSELPPAGPPPSPPSPAPSPSPPAKPCTSCGPPIKGTHFPGGDLGQHCKSASFDDCCDKCKAKAGCVGFVFSASEKDCGLKSSMTGEGAKSAEYVSSRCDQ
jgi:hypothetical protein